MCKTNFIFLEERNGECLLIVNENKNLTVYVLNICLTKYHARLKNKLQF